MAVTLPEDVVAALAQRHEDLGWAIVDLVKKQPAKRPGRNRNIDPVDLVEIGARQSLIVVRSDLLQSLPGIQMVPLSETQAFLALESGRGLADLELAALDRLDNQHLPETERAAVKRLRECLRRWRHDQTLTFQIRSIIIVGHAESAA